ncbi:uncharacterized protein TNCV_4782831 [Trichonephila clavipes]|nr:uncharacterized protein TNCV_4782831 [Trichonephila clavipes]
MTVSRILNRWVQDGNTERRAGSQRPPITSIREGRHHQDGRIRVRWHRGERKLATRSSHRHTGSSPGVIVWFALTSLRTAHVTFLVWNDALAFIRLLRNTTFRQYNARPHVVGLARAFP